MTSARNWWHRDAGAVRFRADHRWLPFGRRPVVVLSVSATAATGIACMIVLIDESQREHQALTFTVLAGLLLLLAAPWVLFRSKRWVEIGPRGVRWMTPNGQDGYSLSTIPASEVAGFEVRRWPVGSGVKLPGLDLTTPSTVFMSVRLKDGRYRKLMWLSRPEDAHATRPVSRLERGLMSEWTAQPADAIGTPLVWTAATDQHFATVLWEQFLAGRAKCGEPKPASERWRPPVSALHPIDWRNPDEASSAAGSNEIVFDTSPPPGPWVRYASEFRRGVGDRAFRDAVTVSAAGIRPTLADQAILPAHLVGRLTVRGWTTSTIRGAGTAIHASVELADGRFALLPALQRPARDLRAPGVILTCSSEDQQWRPLLDERRHAVQWGPSTDVVVLALLNQELDALLDRRASALTANESGSLPQVLEGTHVRTSRSGLPATTTLTSVPAEAAPIRPAPIEVDASRPAVLPLPPSMLSPDEVPAWEDVHFPARYWTLAEERAGHLGRRLATVRFEKRAIVLPGWPRPTSVAYSDVDRFAFRVGELDAWQLSLVLHDGRALALPGLSHGWFKHNALLWDDGRARTPQATGSLRWEDGNDGLVAARLNAQLAAAGVPHTATPKASR